MAVTASPADRCEISPAEWRVRVDLPACYRPIARVPEAFRYLDNLETACRFQLGAMAWQALVRQLDCEDPSYKH